VPPPPEPEDVVVVVVVVVVAVESPPELEPEVMPSLVLSDPELDDVPPSWPSVVGCATAVESFEPSLPLPDGRSPDDVSSVPLSPDEPDRSEPDPPERSSRSAERASSEPRPSIRR
jgi:hypothetical protein